MTDVCFVLAPGQNNFFFELADVFRHELELAGVGTELSIDGFPPPRDDMVYALLPPHEYFALEGAAHPPPPDAMRRTILICAEQPETIHFRQNLALASAGGALFDINERAVRAYRRRGIQAEHLRLGYTSVWDHFYTAEAHTDVLFLGAETPRRAQILAGMAGRIAALDSRLVLSDNSRPNPGGSATFLAGKHKWDALSATRILLNVHQGPEPYFEWHRVLQAIHCGAAVLTETSSDFGPLEPGTDFEMAPAAGLAASLDTLAGDEERRRALAKHAYDRIREELPMTAGAERLAEVADDLSRGGRTGTTAFGRFASKTASMRLRSSARVAARRRTAADAEPVGLASADLMATDIEGAPDLVLVTTAGVDLLPHGLERLCNALEGTPAGFAYGLVALGQEPRGIANVLGPDETHPPAPPVLVRRAIFDEGKGAEDLPALLAGLGGSALGVAVQQFVAAPSGTRHG